MLAIIFIVFSPYESTIRSSKPGCSTLFVSYNTTYMDTQYINTSAYIRYYIKIIAVDSQNVYGDFHIKSLEIYIIIEVRR